MIEAFPLCWPVGYKRTKNADKKHAAFQTSFAKAIDGIVYELKKMSATNVIISTNVPLKKDGLPYAVPFGKTNVTDDTGIAVYFTFNKEQKVICCDSYITLDDNMQAINKTIEALRSIDRWKCSDIINQTFTGFKALPEKIETPWNEVLGVKTGATEDEIKKAYYKKANEYHPDKGGDAGMFDLVNKAYKASLNN